MRFLGLTLADRVPDANSIWNFREALTMALIDGAPAIEILFNCFDAALTKAGFLAMSYRSSTQRFDPPWPMSRACAAFR
jgi:IS5 family transposase